MNDRVASLCIVSMICFVASAVAPAEAQESKKGKSCAAAENSQFDFWVGSWRVSKDRGGTWNDVYVGIYTRVKD